MKWMCRSLLAVAVVCFPTPLLAQVGETGGISGIVQDAAGQPLEGVLVFIDGGFRFTISDASGAFTLDSIPFGVHQLGYRRSGYAPRSFNFPVGPGSGIRNVGIVPLQPGMRPTADLSGVVVQFIGGVPLAGAVVELNGAVVAQTDAQGAFAVDAASVNWGSNEVRITHNSFAAVSTVDGFWISNPEEVIEMEVVLDVAPLSLPGVTAATAARSPRLEEKGFYERQASSSNAIFLTQEDFAAREVHDLDELVRGAIRFPRTRAFTTFGQAGAGNCGSAIRDAVGDPVVMAAGPLLFVDGANAGELRDGGISERLNGELRLEDIEGIEIYRGVANLPVEFNVMGAECGVFVIWTRGSF